MGPERSWPERSVAAAHRYGYVAERIAVWLHPDADPLGRGFQSLQGAYAVAAGAGSEPGYGAGHPTFIPDVATDYVHAAFSEEFGFVGALALLAAYALLVSRALAVARAQADPYPKLLATGVSAMLGFQVIIIVGGVLGLFPLTGITLPFISYGGSSLVANYLAVSLLWAISRGVEDASNPLLASRGGARRVVRPFSRARGLLLWPLATEDRVKGDAFGADGLRARRPYMSMTILVVDDVPTNARVLAGLVRKRILDADPVTFTDPAKALEWCATNEPDLVLLDYVMPGIDGIEFLRRMRAQAHLATIPAIVVTGQEDRPSLYRALEAGANDFLSKPPDEIELTARARNLLKLRSATRDLYRLATTDELTGLANRRHFLANLTDEARRAARYHVPLSLAILDADHFKRINDTYGHPTGDVLLRAVASLCRETFRGVDTVGRIGGEEFAILMPATDSAGARIACERVRHAIAEARVQAGADLIIRATVSIGAAELGAQRGRHHLLARRPCALPREGYGTEPRSRSPAPASRASRAP